MQDAIQNNKAIIFQKSKSTIQFEAAKVSRKHKGSFSEFSAAIIFENNMPQEVVFDIDLRSVKSDDKELDKRLLGRDFFFTQRFPIASFHAKQFQKGKAEHYDVTGTLELRGVQKEITIPVQINNKNKKIQVISNFELNRKDFGIVYRGFPDDIIQDMVSVKLKLSN
jgi:polyisoprenoid-binding protein YceI